MVDTAVLRQKILDTEKITEAQLDEKVKQKLNSLGGLISEEGALHIIANELDVKTASPASSGLIKANEVNPTMRNVSILVKVLKKYELREFGAGDKQGKVGSLYVGDETGALRLTFWNDKTEYFENINENDILEVKQAYARENNGRVELHMGNNAHCEINPEGKTVDMPDRSSSAAQTEYPTKKLQDITEQDSFVNITATIVQVYDPRFFPVDPTTNRKTSEDTGVYNYVMNVFLDDGTSNLRAALWKEQVQELLGKSDEQIVAMKDNADILEEMKTDLLGRIISARARVKKNEAYDNIELVLYNVNPNPKPDASESSSSASQAPASTPLATKAESEKVVEEKPAVQEESKVTSEDLSEELIGDDDEELLSIDDLDDL